MWKAAVSMQAVITRVKKWNANTFFILQLRHPTFLTIHAARVLHHCLLTAQMNVAVVWTSVYVCKCARDFFETPYKPPLLSFFCTPAHTTSSHFPLCLTKYQSEGVSTSLVFYGHGEPGQSFTGQTVRTFSVFLFVFTECALEGKCHVIWWSCVLFVGWLDPPLK